MQTVTLYNLCTSSGFIVDNSVTFELRIETCHCNTVLSFPPRCYHTSINPQYTRNTVLYLMCVTLFKIQAQTEVLYI